MVGGMIKSMMFITVAVIMMINVISAQKLIVGDDSGWVSPPSPGFYDQWAAEQNFAVGDTLVFEFATGAHTVATVTSKDAYEKCDTSLDENPVTVTQGPYEITLTSPGQYYYFCTIGLHCANGQKFAATVSATPTGPTPDSPSPPPPPPTKDSPSPPSPPPTKDSVGALTTSSIFVATLIGLVLALLY